MADILQLLVAGFATGAIYALVAIGFTLLWQTSQTINFAQGEFVMLPAFFVLIGIELFRPVVLAGGGARRRRVASSCSGSLFKRLMVDPMIRHGVLPLVIATIGLAILMKEAVREFYGADAQPFPPRGRRHRRHRVRGRPSRCRAWSCSRSASPRSSPCSSSSTAR